VAAFVGSGGRMTYPEIKVLDHGFVALDDSCADDLSVVNAARVSFNKHHQEMEEGDDKLIAFLLKNRHGTPFEQNFFRFRVKAPIFVFREWHRHRIGISINEWSARYSELEPVFYIPNAGNVRTQTGKPGHYVYEPINVHQGLLFRRDLTEHCEASFRRYQVALNCGVAKEQARFFLPVNIYSEMYWSCNARSLMNFLSLRNAPKAMWEIRQFGIALENIFKEVMPITWQHFVENQRVAP
jgi:thymidylate synthase (FAD)